MRKYGSFIIIATVIGLSLLGAARPAAAATGSLTSASFCRDNGVLTVNFTATGTTDDGGGSDIVTVEVYDDGALVASSNHAVPVGSTQPFTAQFTLSSILEEAPSIGVLLRDGDPLDAIDPVPVATNCAPGGGGGQGAAGEGEAPCKTSFEFGSSDASPITGTLRLFILGGYENVLPEGWMIATIPVTAGEYVSTTIGDVRCGMHVRAWLYNAADQVVGLVPSQYENGDGVFEPYTEDYGTGTGPTSILYAASFSKLIYADGSARSGQGGGGGGMPLPPSPPMPSGGVVPDDATSPPPGGSGGGPSVPPQPPVVPPPPPPSQPGF